jgi:long-chain acyl-CoA synthetase
MNATIVSRLRDLSARQPDTCALQWRQSLWTYAQLHRAARGIAAQLLHAGIAPGERVAILIRNSPQYVAAYYGALLAGCVAVPLNAQERAVVLARQIQHCGARWLYADDTHPEIAGLRTALSESVTISSLPMADDAHAPDLFCDQLPADHEGAGAQCAANVLASIIYTSGTTGRPKGVMLSHGSLAANAATIVGYLALDERDSGLCVLPFHFSYGNSVLQSHLWAGARLVLEDNLAFPHLTLRRLQDERITGFAGVPSTFALFLGRCRFADFDLGALRYLTQAGGSMPQATTQELRRHLPKTHIYIMYGQTEATARLSYLAPDQLESRPGSVGLPIPSVAIEIQDSAGLPVANGEVGEICARGPNVMLGYWQDAEASAAVLRNGWLHTGDLGHLDADGYLYIDGRAVDMIKVGAFRVSPQEIEEAVAALPAVEEAAAVGIDDELLGQAVKVVVVLRAGATLDERTIRAHCRQHLAGYKIPKVVEFAATLPRTSSGKVRRFELTQEVKA